MSPLDLHYLSGPLLDLIVQPMSAYITVSGDLKHLKPNQTFPRISGLGRGCRILYKHRIYISKTLKRIAISTADVGGTYYMAGLDFTSATGESIKVGYLSKYHATDSVEVSRLCGVHIALGAKGFYGLRSTVDGGEHHVGLETSTNRSEQSGWPALAHPWKNWNWASM